MTPNPPIEHAYKVTENFYAGTYPFAKETENGLPKLQKLLDFGITHFIDLTLEPLTKYNEYLPENCTYTNLPTWDNTESAFEDLKKAHDIIRQSKEKVYLHCKGGYDRTGVAVATYFIYLGKTPEEAKKQFRQVSQPVKGRYAHTPLIETRWDVLERYQEWLHSHTRTNSKERLSPLRDKIRGGIFGLAVADALGVPVEFKSRKELQRKPVTGMQGYGTYNQSPGTWSDDTSMTLCLLDSLTKTKRNSDSHCSKPDYADIMQRFLLWQDKGEYTAHGKVFDTGVATRQAIQRFREGITPLQCGGKSEMDNGNGSLMRILPLAFYLYKTSPQFHGECWDIIHDVSSLTHAHKRSQIACGLYLSIAQILLDKSDLNEAIQSGLKTAKEYYERQKEYAADLKHFQRLFDKRFADLPEEEIRSSGYVVDTLEAALWCLRNMDNYKDCVLKAVHLGEDTDTVAAVAGGLAGMFYGVDSIPSEWSEKLVRRKYIEELCIDFCHSLDIV